ncbi:hypothetical protein C8A03DRAFT_47680 [Achaetomium macrosporum]|uniref:Uncharacterized protein n=1 Tax=Achaetomium macrosporum TaxID=79813 RepID=A0AAN7H3Z7_9PEZI|nr:hypothetical protein C8A03DRAFT_47680 [Achaetomium macrosporum]
MASGSSQNPGDKMGLTVETTRLVHKPSQDTLASVEPFPTLEEKDSRLCRPSDASTPATARANPFDTDVEAMITRDSCNRKSAECTKGGSDCQVWPGQDHWKRKAKAAKKSRHTCTCLAKLSKRNRVLVKILIIILVVGAAVAIGFGVSKPLGADIWRSDTQNGR